MRTNCPNCGAVVDMTAKKCTYCGTPYVWALAPEMDEPLELVTSMIPGIVTPNEMRGRLGLPPARVFIGDAPPEDTTGLWIDTSLD